MVMDNTLKQQRIKFDDYDLETQTLTIKAYKAHVFIDMRHETVSVNSHPEIDWIDDTCYALCVLINNKHYPLIYLVQEAERQHNAIRREVMAELEANDAMIDELSSVSKTGRI
jgi:uncharacterized cysteine cluster protein YcgN (CxxCxxCC family)